MKKSYLKYIASVFLFGLNGIIASFIDLNSYEIVLLRTLLGSLLLGFIFYLKKEKFTFYKYKRQSVFLILSGASMGLSWLFLYEAYKKIGVSLSSLAYYCGPVLVMLLSPRIFKEKLTLPRLISFLTVLFGIVILNGASFSEKVDLFGLFCGGMSAVMYAFMVIFNKKANNITGIENSFIQLTVSFFTVAVFLIFKNRIFFEISESDIIPVLILGIINTGFGCYLYFSSINNLKAQSVAILGYIEPLCAVILSALILREAMTSVQYLGAALIIGGAFFGEIKK